MLPITIIDNVADEGAGHSKVLAELLQRHPSRSKSVSDFKHRCIGEFVHWLLLPFTVAVFIVAVLVVIGLSANREVCWIAAQPGIARMENVESVWNISIVENPRNSVDQIYFLSAVNSPVAVPACRTWPQPTAIAFCDSFPKTIGDRQSLSNLAKGVKCSDDLQRFDVVAHIVFSGAAPYREAAFAFQDYQSRILLQA